MLDWNTNKALIWFLIQPVRQCLGPLINFGSEASRLIRHKYVGWFRLGMHQLTGGEVNPFQIGLKGYPGSMLGAKQYSSVSYMFHLLVIFAHLEENLCWFNFNGLSVLFEPNLGWEATHSKGIFKWSMVSTACLARESVNKTMYIAVDNQNDHLIM